MNTTSNKKKILIHDGQHHLLKSLNYYLLNNDNNKDIDIIFGQMHQNLFNIQQQYNADKVLWPLSEYTQEFHNFIIDYHQNINIYLLIDRELDKEDLLKWLNNTNIKMISHNKYAANYKNIVATFNDMYDERLFFEKHENRIDQTVVLLDPVNNEKNHKLDTVLYPNNNNIVVMGNPNYETNVNIGLYNYVDLAQILNTYSRVLDLTNSYELESSACNIDYIDNSDNFIESLKNNHIKSKIVNLEQKTYKNFVDNHLIKIIKE